MITGLCSWYDEDPGMLYDTVTSWRGTIDRLITLDGPYALFPDAQPRSPQEQHNTIREAADEAGIELEAHTVRRAFRDEMEKRTKLFSLAPDEGWLIWLDADEPVRYPDPNLTDTLESTDRDVATFLILEAEFSSPWLTLHQDGQPTVIDGRHVYRLPRIYRAGLGITVPQYHNDVRTADGRNLWGRNSVTPTETVLVVDHRTEQRYPDRKARAKAYYHLRDSLRVEQGMCEVCSANPATTEAATPERDWLVVCESCANVMGMDARRNQRVADLKSGKRRPMVYEPRLLEEAEPSGQA